MKRAALLALSALLALLALVGCETLGYYGQAVSGQLHILTHRQDIDRLLSADDTAPDLKARLQTVRELLDFAESELQLPTEDQYNTYVDVQRPFVVWNVVAAPEFSVAPLTWCFPVAGCVSYRGYFREAAALEQRDKLQGQGFDVYMGGVSAYSTLGWFSDPVLNTVIQREPPQLAALLFHELAHQVAYAPGDTGFNESFATAVEQTGLQRWIAATLSKEDGAALLTSLKQEQQQRDEFVTLVQKAVTDLDQLYRSAETPENMRVRKQMRLNQLRAEYADLQQRWGTDGGYGRWFAQALNNAQLSTVATYNQLVPAFLALLQQCKQELPCLYAEAQRLAELSQEARNTELSALLPL